MIGQTRDSPVAGNGGHGGTDGSALNGAAEMGQPGAASRRTITGGAGHQIALRSSGNAADLKMLAGTGAAGSGGESRKETGHGGDPDGYGSGGEIRPYAHMSETGPIWFKKS